jgi:ATP-dependent Lhr-like helicase
LTRTELDARCDADPALWIEDLRRDRRIIEVSIAGQSHLADAADAGRLRDALGCAIPVGLPVAFTESMADPLVELVARFARTHGPFVVAQAANRFGIAPDRLQPALERLESQGRVVHGEFRPGGVEREWCDADVLRQLRRRSLAALRREVEPVTQQAFARFLPAWQGVGGRHRGVDALADVIAVLGGAAIPASVVERDVLTARLDAYRPADLDALCTAGEVVWVGAGAIGSTDGRIRLAFRDQAPLLLGGPAGDPANPAGGDRPDDELHRVLLEQLAGRGASFWADLVLAAQRAGLPHDDATVLAALWDLVWAGLVTNDSLAPLRALVGRSGSRTTSRQDRQRGRGRPRLGRLARLGPAAGAGRWSLVAPLLQPAPSPTEALTARALQLLERYGVLTREAALGEGAEGGFAGVYPVLKALEERGQVRRGYFVDGLGAAQFALPGAVDRLRLHRSSSRDDGPPPHDQADGAAEHPDEVLVLAATDPAQPFGAALAWPTSAGRPARAAGAHVLLHEGEAVAYLERSGRSLLTFPAAEADDGWPRALAQLVDRGRYRQIELARIDGEPAVDAPLAPQLRLHGFRDGYRGLVLRAER